MLVDIGLAGSADRETVLPGVLPALTSGFKVVTLCSPAQADVRDVRLARAVDVIDGGARDLVPLGLAFARSAALAPDAPSVLKTVKGFPRETGPLKRFAPGERAEGAGNAHTHFHTCTTYLIGAC